MIVDNGEEFTDYLRPRSDAGHAKPCMLTWEKCLTDRVYTQTFHCHVPLGFVEYVPGRWAMGTLNTEVTLRRWDNGAAWMWTVEQVGHGTLPCERRDRVEHGEAKTAIDAIREAERACGFSLLAVRRPFCRWPCAAAMRCMPNTTTETDQNGMFAEC